MNVLERLTDSKVAAVLKSNYEDLQGVGIKPSPNHLQYVRLAELEEVYPKLVGGIALCKELLRLAMADMEDSEDCDTCVYDSAHCPGVTGDCTFKWRYADEALKLIGGSEK